MLEGQTKESEQRRLSCGNQQSFSPRICTMSRGVHISFDLICGSSLVPRLPIDPWWSEKERSSNHVGEFERSGIYRFSLRVYWLYSIRYIFEEIEAPFLIKWHPEKKCNASSASGASAVASMVCFCCNSRLGIYLLYLYVAIMVETLRRIKDFSVEGALVYLITPWTIWWYTILKNVLEQVRITPDSITYCYGGAWGIGVDNTCPSLASM